MLDKRIIYRARDIARNAGYDPDQLVVEISKEEDFDFLEIGLAPVNITEIKPVFMKFYQIAQREMAWENQLQSIATI